MSFLNHIGLLMKVQNRQSLMLILIHISTVNHLHRQNALYVANLTKLPCDKIYDAILKEANKVRISNKKSSHQSVFMLRCLARRSSCINVLPCFWC